MVVPTNSVFFVVSFFLAAAVTTSSAAVLGGWTVVQNVGSDKDVQDLGRFSVSEYNTRLRSAGSPALTFARVVTAEQQVVSGMNYRLRIAVTDGVTNGERFYDSVVYVKPWMKYKKVISFTPSKSSVWLIG